MKSHLVASSCHVGTVKSNWTQKYIFHHLFDFPYLLGEQTKSMPGTMTLENTWLSSHQTWPGIIRNEEHRSTKTSTTSCSTAVPESFLKLLGLWTKNIPTKSWASEISHMFLAQFLLAGNPEHSTLISVCWTMALRTDCRPCSLLILCQSCWS